MVFRRKPGFTERKFWAKVVKGPSCWIWTGSRSDFGHGTVRINNRLLRAHRVVWEWTNGPLPPETCVLHTCDNPPCVRPDHLFTGSKQSNTDDMMKKGRLVVGRRLKGEDHPASKLSQETVADIRQRYAGGGVTQKQLGTEFCVSQVLIGKIVRGEIWRQTSS